MSCCSIKKAVKKLGSNIQGSIIDPVRKEGSRIESKTRAELKRIPDNIDKATAKIKTTVKGAFSDVFSLLPGSGAVKLIGIGIAAIIGLSILRRVSK